MITVTLVLCAGFVSYFWLKRQATASPPEQDLTNLVQARRPPVVETIEHWERKKRLP
jgi:hypothetical protein